MERQAKFLNCDRLHGILTNAIKERSKRKKYTIQSRASSILSQWNEFTLMRLEYAKLYPALKPDDIFNTSYNQILNELTMSAELSMIDENINAIIKEETEQKNRRNGK